MWIWYVWMWGVGVRRVCLSVCVWNVWTDVKLLPCISFLNCTGPGTHDCLSWPTKTKQHGGANVPQFLIFRYGTWLTQEPPCQANCLPISISIFVGFDYLGLFLYSFRNLEPSWLVFIPLFGFSHAHFSPTFRSEGMDQYWMLLVRALESLRYWPNSTWLFPWVHLGGPPKIHNRFRFCMNGIQFPVDHYDDPFLI